MSGGAVRAIPTPRYDAREVTAAPVLIGGSGAASIPSPHVLGHLTPTQQRVALALAQPVTVEEAAQQLRMSRRATEHQWYAVRAALGLPGAATGTTAVSRVALTRVLLGIDPCFCDRSAS